MKKRRVQFALGALMCVGAFMTLSGIVGPITAGATIAEVVVDELKLPHEPDTYTKLAHIYANSSERQHALLAFVGLFIVVTSGVGLSGTHGE